MGPGQREGCGIVVECGRGPSGLGVAFQAVMVELVGDVAWVRRSVVVRRVTRPAVLGGSRVSVVRVARDAGCGFMCPGQRESRGIVVECGRGPSGLGVAFQAVMVELVGNVARFGDPIVVRSMARPAVHGSARVGPFVAVAASETGMSLRQLKRTGVPINGPLPRHRVPRMTVCAFLAERGFPVIRIRGPIEILPMA
jgi:hypothetical protein